MSSSSPGERIADGIALWVRSNLGTYLERANQVQQVRLVPFLRENGDSARLLGVGFVHVSAESGIVHVLSFASGQIPFTRSYGQSSPVLTVDGYSAPLPRKVEVASWIPQEGPFPYLMVNVEEISYDPAGNWCERYTARITLAAMVHEPQRSMIGRALARYMDAISDAVRDNPTLDGVADYIRVERVEKGEIPADNRGWVTADLVATGEVSS